MIVGRIDENKVRSSEGNFKISEFSVGVKEMNITKMEKQVKTNSSLLDKKINSLIKANKDKYVVFHKGEHYIADTLKEGLQKGIQTFGEDTGFVLEKLTKTMPILSSLVKL